MDGLTGGENACGDPAPRALTAALWADFRREGSVALSVHTRPLNPPDVSDRGICGDLEHLEQREISRIAQHHA